MAETNTLISVIDFKSLLLHLKDARPDICIRCRLLGEMWMTGFTTIFVITEKGVVLIDDARRKSYLITDISNIMQFEIDKPFGGYQPYYHYEVQPLLNFKSVLH